MKKLILHPFIFALYSVMFLFAANIDRVPVQKTFPLILILLAGSALILGLFWLLVRDIYRAGLVSTLTILLVTSFGSVYNLLSGKLFFGFPIGQANILAALCAAGYILVGWWIIRKLPNPQPLNTALNIFSVILICLPILQIGLYVLSNPKILSPARSVAETQPAAGPQPPDIYYIVLDEYGRSDVLKEVMSYDNSAFIDYLKKKGFYVAENSHANYGISHLSLASSLNYQYLDEKMASITRTKADDVSEVTSMIHNSQARAFLEAAGYRFVTFATGYPFTEIDDGDEFLQPEGYINGFELQYFNNTIFVLSSQSVLGNQYRSLILNALHGMASLPEDRPDMPKFVFAHINAAHVPFVFGPDGEAVHPWIYSDPSNADGTGTISYSEAYQRQAAYINKEVEQTIDAILAKSKRKPVIILQGDHGPESLLDWTSVENTCVRERLSILNAYYFPDRDYGKLYPAITPVNTFRVVFDQYLGTKLGLLEDRSYFSLWAKPYDFINVSDRLDIPCKAVK